MLIISRQVHEQIWIGDNIVIAVAYLAPDRVRLAIEAPNLLILRDDANPGVGKDNGSGRLTRTRRRRQSIFIGDSITVTVTRSGRGRVSIGIEAPADLKIRREKPGQTAPSDRAPAPKVLPHSDRQSPKQRIAIGSQRRNAS